MKRNVLSIALTLAAVLAIGVAGTVSAADYSTEIEAATTAILADLALNVPSAVALGLGLFGVMTGLIVLFKALKKGRSAA